MSRASRSLIGCLLLSLSLGLTSGAEVGLAEADILKVDWDTRDLTSADLDGDGRQDLAIINNEQARIDLYYQLAPGETPGQTERKTTPDRWEPILDDAPFERLKVLTGSAAYDMVFGDLNGDKRLDLVYTNDRDEIVVHWQGEKSDWTDKQFFEFQDLAPRTMTLWIGDLSGDGKNDLVVSTETELLLFPDGKLSEKPTRYATAVDGPRALAVHDLNGDQRLDLAYYDLNRRSEYALVVRFQSEDGHFVSERFFEFKYTNNLPVPVNWGESNEQVFIAVSGANHTLVSLTMQPRPEKSPNKAGDTTSSFFREAYAIPGNSSKPAHFAIGDFDGDGDQDVVASDGSGAQVWYYQQQQSGQLRAPESFPAFAEISDLASGDVDGDGRAELIMMSSTEGAVGVARFTEERRFEYPETLPLSSKPTHMVAGDLDGDGRVEIMCSVEGDSNRKHQLEWTERFEGNWKRHALEDSVSSRLQGLRLSDIDQDGDVDLLALSSVQALEAFLQQSDGTFKAPETAPAGLADNIDPKAITHADIDGDGKEEWLVTRDAFTRTARLGAEGRSEILDQINAPGAEASLLVAHATDTDGDAKPELLLVDSQDRKIHLMKRDAKGVFRAAAAHPGIEELSGSRLVDADGDGHEDLFLFANDHFWWYRLHLDPIVLTEAPLYETDLKDTIYSELIAAPLNGDPLDDLVVFDTDPNHVLEMLLSQSSEGNAMPTLKSALHFKLFEIDPHFQGQTGGRFQPHSAVLADLTADGKQDIALLMHDRLVVYPQK